MKHVALALLLASLAGPTAAQQLGNRDVTGQTEGFTWIESEARITSVVATQDGLFHYTMEYTPHGSAKPIQHHHLGKPRQPVEGQRIRVLYAKEEPVRFKLVDPIVFR